MREQRDHALANARSYEFEAKRLKAVHVSLEARAKAAEQARDQARSKTALLQQQQKLITEQDATVTDEQD